MGKENYKKHSSKTLGNMCENIEQKIGKGTEKDSEDIRETIKIENAS